jgi:hypothetical protein
MKTILERIPANALTKPFDPQTAAGGRLLPAGELMMITDVSKYFCILPDTLRQRETGQ